MSAMMIQPKGQVSNYVFDNKQQVLNAVLSKELIRIKDICNLRLLNREWKQAVHNNSICVSTLSLLFAKRCQLSIFQIGPKPEPFAFKKKYDFPSYLAPSLQSNPIYMNTLQNFLISPSFQLLVDHNLMDYLQTFTEAIVKNGNLDNALVPFILERLTEYYNFLKERSLNNDKISILFAMLQNEEMALKTSESKDHHILDIYSTILEVKISSFKTRGVEVDKVEAKDLLKKAKQNAKNAKPGKNEENKIKALCRLVKIEASLGFWQDAIETIKEVDFSKTDYILNGPLKEIARTLKQQGCEISGLQIPADFLSALKKAVENLTNEETDLSKTEIKDIDSSLEKLLELGKSLKGIGFSDELAQVLTLAKEQNKPDILNRVKEIIPSFDVEYQAQSLILIAQAQKHFKNEEYISSLAEASRGIFKVENEYKRTDQNILLAKATFQLGHQESAMNLLDASVDKEQFARGMGVIERLIKYALAFAELGNFEKAFAIMRDVPNRNHEKNRKYDVKYDVARANAKIKMYTGDIKGAIKEITNAFEEAHRLSGIVDMKGFMQLFDLYTANKGTFTKLI